ncbi:MAG: tyrosine-type recombinase/integrase [Bacteroidota bacterium]
MGYSIKIKLREQYIRADGKTNFQLVVYIHGQRKFYPIDIYIEPKHWNGQKVLSTHARNNEYNAILKDTLFKAEQCIIDLQRDQKELSITNFEQLYFSYSKRGEILTIEKAFDNYYDYYIGIYKASSMKIYKTQKNKMVEYAGVNFPIANIDEIFYMKYRKHLIEIVGNKQNTLTNAIKKLKAVINFSIKTGLLKENKLTMVHEREQESNRESLEVEELDKLELLLESDKLNIKLRDVLVLFLFSCYTSIRFTDITLLTIDNISDNFISFVQTKIETESQRKVQVPITPRCKRLIDKYANTTQPRQPLFKSISNQKTNEYLKIIMLYETVNINRNITFHSARHTFAMNALNFGMEIEYVQKILGHSKVSTTEIYAKYKKDILSKMADKYLNF